ncbi:hypothetical protein WEH80_29445 [Actinomycetes bacterium KLBMP 9759]
MDLGCSLCVAAGSAGGAVTGFCIGRRSQPLRGRRVGGARAMRAWPGARRVERRRGEHRRANWRDL